MKRFLVGLLLALGFASPALADPNGPVAPGGAASQSSLGGCVYNSAAPTLTSGQQVAVQCDVNGKIITSGGGGGGGAVTVADGADVTQGALADATWSGSGSGSQTSILKYIGVKNEAIRALLGAPLAVTGTFWQATQPVSGTFWQATQPVSGTFWQATQPVSGTVTASNTTGNIASAATDSGNPVKVGCIFNTSFPTVTNGQRVDCQGAPSGAQYVQSQITTNPASTASNRPGDTTAYSALDLMANSTTAGSVVVPSFATNRTACSFDLALMKLSWNGTGTGPGTGMDGASITVRLWSAAPTYVNGDNGAYRVATGGAGILGVFTCVLTQYDDAASGFCKAADNYPVSVKLASGTSVFWDEQAQGAIPIQASKAPTLTPYLKNDLC